MLPYWWRPIPHLHRTPPTQPDWRPKVQPAIPQTRRVGRYNLCPPPMIPNEPLAACYPQSPRGWLLRCWYLYEQGSGAAYTSHLAHCPYSMCLRQYLCRLRFYCRQFAAMTAGTVHCQNLIGSNSSLARWFHVGSAIGHHPHYLRFPPYH